MTHRPLASLFLVLCALTGCGDLPAPFWGNPGAAGRRLAQPRAPMLAVAPPVDAMLSDTAGSGLASDLAQAMQDREVPALARAPRPTDWQLLTRAERKGTDVVPFFLVRDPDGVDQGTVEGAPVPLPSWASA